MYVDNVMDWRLSTSATRTKSHQLGCVRWRLLLLCISVVQLTSIQVGSGSNRLNLTSSKNATLNESTWNLISKLIFLHFNTWLTAVKDTIMKMSLLISAMSWNPADLTWVYVTDNWNSTWDCTLPFSECWPSTSWCRAYYRPRTRWRWSIRCAGIRARTTEGAALSDWPWNQSSLRCDVETLCPSDAEPAEPATKWRRHHWLHSMWVPLSVCILIMFTLSQQFNILCPKL